jgi:hypothetical protein
MIGPHFAFFLKYACFYKAVVYKFKRFLQSLFLAIGKSQLDILSQGFELVQSFAR